MRSVSQIIVAILLVGAAVVAGSLLSYIVTDMISTYKPSEVMIARVGSINVELREVTSDYYEFVATVKLANMGTQQYPIEGGRIIILIKGTTGKAEIIGCEIIPTTVKPGEVKTVSGICQLDKNMIRDLFGTPTIPADKIKSSMTFLYLHIYMVQSCGPNTPCVPSEVYIV